MKTFKSYVFILVTLIGTLCLSSCESDEERGFDISGMYGKTWWGGTWDLKTDTESLFIVISHFLREPLPTMAWE